MIESIRLRNFQKHSDLLVTLDPHVTVIVGKTDAGKSSLVRALRWVCSNKPQGDSFKKRGKEFVRVELSVDGRLVKRSRGKKNIYSIDGKKFVAFGQGVPTEVEDLLNVSAVNFQSQHDPVFWFTLPPPDVSRELNSVVNLQLIDSASKSISTEKHRCKEKVKFCEERISALKLKELSLNWVVQASEDWEEVERLRGIRDGIAANRAALACTLSEAIRTGDEHRSLRRVLSEGSDVLEMCRNFLQVVGKSDTLRKLVESYRSNEEATSSSVVEDFARLEGLRTVRMDLERGNVELASLLEQFKEHEDAKCLAEKSSTRLARELREMTEGQNCPT